MVSQMEDFASSRAFHVAGPKAFAEASIHPQMCRPPDDLRRLRPSAIYGLEDLGFVPRGEAGPFIAERNTAPAAGRRSTPMAVFPTCTAYTPCRRACAGARVSYSPDPRRQNLGLPRRRQVRRIRHHHHVERAALRRRSKPRRSAPRAHGPAATDSCRRSPRIIGRNTTREAGDRGAEVQPGIGAAGECRIV